MAITLKDFSLKNFITDLPRMLNESFKTIVDVINKVYDDETGKISADSIKVEGEVTANTVTANTFTFRGPNGTDVTSNEILNRLTRLEKRIASI